MFHNQFAGLFGRSYFQRGKGSLGFLRTLFSQIRVGRWRWRGAHRSQCEQRSLPTKESRKQCAPPAASSSDSVYPREGMAPQRKEGRLGPAVLGEDPVPALPTIFLQILFFHSPSHPSLPHSWQLPRRKGKGSQGGLQFPLVLVWSCLPLRHRGSVSLALEHRHPNLQPNSDSVRSVPNCEGAGSRPELVRASPRRDQRCAGSRAAAEPLDFRAQKAERRRFPSSRISGQGRPWKFPWPFLPTGDFSTCPRRRNKVVAGAGGRSRFPKSPFTSLISVTRPRSTSRSS